MTSPLNPESATVDALLAENRRANRETFLSDVIYERLESLLQAGAGNTSTEWVFAALNAQDLLNRIDVSRGRVPKFPGMLRVSKVTK